jgi:tripartite ATP-independent transporter DctM subunit
MDDVWLTLIVLFGLMFLGMPVAFSILIAALLGLFLSGLPMLVAAQRMVAGIDSYAMLAVPLFLLMGALMNEAQLTQRLIDFLNKVIGRYRGGLGAVNVTASMVNGGMSGSALADSAMVGSVLIPTMVRSGYTRGYSAAITGASSIVGPIIPPSIPFIVYGSLFGVSIGQLFLGGLIPGLLIGAMLLLSNYLYSRYAGIGGLPAVAMPAIWRAFVDAFPVLLTPVVILGGMFGGLFTPTEAAAAGVVYAAILGVLVYRTLGVRQIGRALASTALSASALFLIISVSAAYGWYLARSDVGALVLDLFSPIRDNRLLVLAAINVVLIVFGCFMETWAVFFLIVPMLMPLVASLGVDPVHFGILLVLNLNIGLVTPPFGMCMFIANQIAGSGVREFMRGMAPFAPALVVMLILVTFLPELTLWLPRAFALN